MARPFYREFVFARKQHDNGDKTILGQTGNFDGDDVVQLALASPECAPFLAGKLWAYFGSEKANPEVVNALAVDLRANDYEVASALRTLFRSAAFYDPAVRRTQIKSPVQWLVQTCKTLGTPIPEPPLLAGALVQLVQLGQLPFVPPNVGGWEWGRSWINSTTLILRYNLAGLIAEGQGSIVQGVGYPNPNRSHFRSTEIWQRASVDPREYHGWMGRYLRRLLFRRGSHSWRGHWAFDPRGIRHAQLLGNVDEAISAFVKDLRAQGNFNRVLLMTFSEFGRRVAENNSGGTDHGAAAPLFMVGGGIKGGVFGKTPSLTDLESGDLKYGTDFRSVYASVLENWLRTPSVPILGENFGTLPLV